METIESLRRKIAVTEDLREVVKTMKTLAAVSIRQYEKAVESLRQYSRTVEMGMQIVLRSHQENSVQPPPAAGGRLGAIIFGSELGMCGQFNEMLVSYALDEFQKLRVGRKNRSIIAVGDRAVVPSGGGGRGSGGLLCRSRLASVASPPGFRRYS